MTTGKSPFHMEAAGSLTPDLEASVCTLRHTKRSQPPEKASQAPTEPAKNGQVKK